MKYRNTNNKSPSSKKSKSVLLLISPMYLGVFSAVLGIAMTLYPKNAYENLMLEQDYMFLNPQLFLFILTCIIGFLLGIFFVRTTYKKSIDKTHDLFITDRFALFQIIFLIISCLISAYYFYFITKNVGNLFFLLKSGMGSTVRNNGALAFDVNGVNSSSLLIANIAIINYTYFQFGKYKRNLAHYRFLVRTLLLLAIVLFVLTCFVIQARYLLMPCIVSLFIITIYNKYNNSNFNVFKLIRYSIVFLTIVILLFLLISTIRDSYRTNFALSNNFAGYTLASYNRLAAIVSGNLIMPNSGSGFYILKSFWYPSLIRRIFDVYQLGLSLGLNLPDSPTSNFLQTFNSVQLAGLQPGYNWPTTFGEVFSDLGWFSFVYFFIYGAVSWRVFLSFLNHKTWAIILYPYIAFCILFWFGTNQIVDSKISIIIITILFIKFMEWIIPLKPSKEFVESKYKVDSHVAKKAI
jgi:oligosaccharide repeat unit polymerase